MVLLQVAESVDVMGGLQPIVEAIGPIVTKITILLGGLAGVYAILLLARVHYERKKVKILENIRYDLDHLNMHYGIPHSRQKRGIFHKLFDWIFPSHNQKHKVEVDVHEFYARKKRL